MLVDSSIVCGGKKLLCCGVRVEGMVMSIVDHYGVPPDRMFLENAV